MTATVTGVLICAIMALAFIAQLVSAFGFQARLQAIADISALQSAESGSCAPANELASYSNVKLDLCQTSANETVIKVSQTSIFGNITKHATAGRICVKLE